jgi:hypothetical protein
MTLGGGPMNMTVDAADDWCDAGLGIVQKLGLS